MTIPATVLDEIRLAVVEAFYSVPRGGVEIGGVFFGVYLGDSLHIHTYRPVNCQYLSGPSFKLSTDDKKGLSSVVGLPASDAKLSGLSAIGWYHSHNRSEIFLSPDDLQLHREFFPERWQIALVLRPVHLQPTRAGFFFRDLLGVIKSDAAVQEFILDPPGYGLTPLDPEADNAVAQTMPAHSVPAGLPEQDMPSERNVVSALPSPAAPIANGSVATFTDIEEETDPEVPEMAAETEDIAELDLGPDNEPGTLHAMGLAILEIAEREAGGSAPASGVQALSPETQTRQERREATVGIQPVGAPAEGESPEKTSWSNRWIRSLLPDRRSAKKGPGDIDGASAPGVPADRLKSDLKRRSARRLPGDGLIAFYGDPTGHRVRDISSLGAYVETDFSWFPGTRLLLTLQICSNGGQDTRPPDSIMVPAEVVRTSPQGMGLRFAFRSMSELQSFLEFLGRWNPNLARNPRGDHGAR